MAAAEFPLRRTARLFSGAGLPGAGRGPLGAGRCSPPACVSCDCGLSTWHYEGRLVCGPCGISPAAVPIVWDPPASASRTLGRQACANTPAQVFWRTPLSQARDTLKKRNCTNNINEKRIRDNFGLILVNFITLREAAIPHSPGPLRGWQLHVTLRCSLQAAGGSQCGQKELCPAALSIFALLSTLPWWGAWLCASPYR